MSKRPLYLYPKERAGVTYPFCYWDNLFTEEELDKIEEYCSSLELVKGTTVGKDGKADESNEARKSNIAFVNPNDDNRWIFERLMWVAERLNERFYEFDLNGFDAFQYTVYDGDEEEPGRYDIHMDTILGTDKPIEMLETRKLSLTVVLNDPDEWEGGKFQMQIGGPEEEKYLTADQIRGRVIAFPSFLLHRVSPVTKGIRKSIVVWVEGPKFK